MNENNQFQNNTVQQDNELGEKRKYLSKIGLACFAVLGLQLLLSIVFSYLVVSDHPEFASSDNIVYWIFQLVVQYVISMPLGMLLLKKVGSYEGKSEKLPKGASVCLLCMAFAGTYIGSLASNFINNIIYNQFGVYSMTPSIEITDWISGIGVFVLMVICAPIFEELFFRKYLVGALKPFGDKTAILIGAMIFALAHANLGQLIYAFLVGMLLSYVYLRTGSIKTGVVIHFIINLIFGFFPTLVNSMMDADVYKEILSKVSGFSSSDPEAVIGFLREMADIIDWIPALVINSFDTALILGFSLAGIILFFVKRKEIRLNKGERSLNRTDIGYAVFLAPGMMIYILLAVFCTAVSFFVS